VPDPTPDSWLQATMVGNVLSFVDCRFTEARLTEGVAARLKGVKNIDVQPIALREIFTTLARESRGGSPS
jgi:hypothetical protein